MMPHTFSLTAVLASTVLACLVLLTLHSSLFFGAKEHPRYTPAGRWEFTAICLLLFSGALEYILTVFNIRTVSSSLLIGSSLWIIGYATPTVIQTFWDKNESITEKIRPLISSLVVILCCGVLLALWR